jgi:hypothetical protein
MDYNVGDIVYDRASKRVATIVERNIEELGDEVFTSFYLLDDSVPLDPTGDGVFLDRWRCESELCDPEDHKAIHEK